LIGLRSIYRSCYRHIPIVLFTSCLQFIEEIPDSGSTFPSFPAFDLIVTVCMQRKIKIMQHTRGNLHFARKLRRLSQRQVAHLIGHRDSTMLSKYEKGLVAPPLRTALKLTLLYRLPVHEIFTEEFSQAKEELAKKIKTVRMKQQVLF
jgi:DNA-binding XRE family transcriptional regulator